MRGALAVLGVCAAVVLGGCGGGDDSTTSASSESSPTTNSAQPSQQGTASSPQKPGESSAKKDKAKSEGSGAKGDSQQQGNGSSSKQDSSPENPQRTKVPPISSAPVAGSRKPAPGVKTTKNGDDSVQEYGVESDSTERREASIALQAYLNARADEDWGTACSYLATRPMQQLERVQAAAAKQGHKLDGCPQTMALLKEGEGQSQEQAQITEVLSFRGGGDISGDPSYLIYVAPPGKTLFSMPMYSQGGSWKVGLARAAELPVG